MADQPQMIEPVGSGLGVGRRGSRSGSKTSLEKTRTAEHMSNEPDSDEDNQWMPDHDPRDERGEFASRAQFLLTVIGFTLGNGSFYHIPLAMRTHGCATFIVMYLFCMIVFGIPMLYLEMMIGQVMKYTEARSATIYCSSRSDASFPAELLQGVGWAVCFLSFLRACNYSLLNAYSLEYAVESLVGVAHRTVCTNKWNSPACFSPKSNKEFCSTNETMPALFNNTCISMEQRVKNDPPDEMAAREYFRHTLRGLPASFDEGKKYHMEAEYSFQSGRVIVCFCLVWIFTSLCLLRRMRWLGKLSLFIVSGSGFLIFLFTIRCLTMERAEIGLQKFFRFNPAKFYDPYAWTHAFRLARVSLSLGLGGMITMASFNKRSKDAFWDSIIVGVVVFMVNLVSAMNIFIIISYCRHLFPFLNWANKEKYATAYIVYYIYFPEVISNMGFSVLWSFLYYGILFGLGVTTFLGLLETPISALTEQFKFCRKHRSITIIILGIVGFGVGFIQCSRVGYHIFYILDLRVLTFYAEIMVGFQVITIVCYGPANFYRDISASIGKKVNLFGYFISPYGLLVRISQFILSPLLLAYGFYENSTKLFIMSNAEGVCKRKMELLETVLYLCTTLASMALIPYPIIIVGAVIALVKHRKAGKPWFELLRPDPMHPSVRYKVPPPLGCIFGLKPIEAMPPAMGDDNVVVDFPEKGIAKPKEEEAILELN
ncbi:hypothetical protein PRIPAC_72869 [Pristionchus pacificus]|uniref:Neurotransmitter transporter n=1 Tax=Pristionchus pacificus TaxID=54126 RepID=A0A2A6CGI9_PRIPA|nr:hypothetical protein PRIPAC_72869 [Pristionchus pacificus]|eukprot:PDM77207.1 neurotransmitter transporter [Pristionchus pacificus]